MRHQLDPEKLERLDFLGLLSHADFNVQMPKVVTRHLIETSPRFAHFDEDLAYLQFSAPWLNKKTQAELSRVTDLWDTDASSYIFDKQVEWVTEHADSAEKGLSFEEAKLALPNLLSELIGLQHDAVQTARFLAEEEYMHAHRGERWTRAMDDALTSKKAKAAAQTLTGKVSIRQIGTLEDRRAVQTKKRRF